MTKHTANRNHPNRSKRLSALENSHTELLAALKATARWHTVGRCWCDLERKAAAFAGTKIHTNGCKLASAAIARAESLAPSNQ